MRALSGRCGVRRGPRREHSARVLRERAHLTRASSMRGPRREGEEGLTCKLQTKLNALFAFSYLLNN